jgi:dienelactone hydrolase
MRTTIPMVTAVLTVFLVPRAAAQTLSADWLGEARGPMPTGTTEMIWIDSARDETTTADPSDKRRVTIRMWYPATYEEPAEHAPYAFALEAYDEETQRDFSRIAAWPTRSVLDAAAARSPARFPVLIYNPGFRLPVFSGTFQTEFLASHGYVVVAVGHTGIDSRVEFPDGYRYEPMPVEEEPTQALPPDTPQVELYRRGGQRAELKARSELMRRDTKFIIDELERINRTRSHRFHERLDLAKIGVFGFSIGGAAALQSTLEEPRVVAAANLDGGLNGQSVLTNGARRPILHFQATHNFPSVANGPAEAGMEEFFVEVERELWQMMRLSTDAWYRVSIEGTVHPHFSDAFLAVPAPPDLIEPRRGHFLMNRVTLEFFDRHLRGSEATPILSHQETFPDLRVNSRAPPQAAR